MSKIAIQRGAIRMGRMGQTSKAILKAAGKVGGLLLLSIVAPQLPYMFLRSYWRGKRLDRAQMRKALDRMYKSKLIEYRMKGDVFHIRLTERGKKKYVEVQFDDMKIEKPKRWDKKWRMVIFDIPDKKKAARDSLRKKLCDLGFFQFQKSVFAHPYDAKDMVDFIIDFFDVEPFVEYLIVESLSREGLLKEKFGLS